MVFISPTEHFKKQRRADRGFLEGLRGKRRKSVARLHRNRTKRAYMFFASSGTRHRSGWIV